MKIPTLPFSPNDFLRYPKDSWISLHSEAPDSELVRELHATIKTGTYEDVKHVMWKAAAICGTHNIGVLYMAVEPATGNTLIHTAMLAQRIEVIDILRHIREHDIGRFHKVFYALVSHQNHYGDTILHLAVRSGNLDLVKAAMQVFYHGYIDEAKEMLQNAEERQSYMAYIEEDEYWDDFSEDEDGNSMRVGNLTFLLQQNNQGQTAIDEARLSGYADIVVWLDRNLKLYDPRGERFDRANVQIWRESCDVYYGIP